MKENQMENFSEISDSGVWNKVQTIKCIKRIENINEILSLLNNSTMLRYLKYNLDEYCEIIVAILQKVETEALYLEILDHEAFLPEAIKEQDAFPGKFLKITVPVLIDTCFKMKENKKVVDLTRRIIQKSLFSGTHRNLQCFLNDCFKNEKCMEEHSFCKKLFKYLVVLYNQEELGNFGLKLICESCFKQFKNFDSLYKMLIILVDMMGFELKETFNVHKFKYSVTDLNIDQSLEIITHLSDILSNSKIELEHEVNNVTFSTFIKDLCRSIMVDTCTPHRFSYKICINFIKISPLIVESVIDELIIYFMLNDNSGNATDYENLLLKVFETYNKLHRIQSLISKMIVVISSDSNKNKMENPSYKFKIDVEIPRKEHLLLIDNMIPLSVLKYFVECIIYLASWQTINLFKTLLFHLRKAVEDLNDNTEDEPNKLLYIETLSTLTCWVLSSVRMAEHTVAPVTVEKFRRGLVDLRTTLSTFGSTILQKEHCHILMRTFLNLCFYWGEVYIIIENYLISNKVEFMKSLEFNSNTSTLNYLYSYVDDKKWGLISERVNNFGEKRCKHLMSKLILQKLKTMVIFDDTITEDITNSLIKELLSNVDDESIDIFTDSFFIYYIFEKMATCNIIKLGDIYLQQLLSGNSTVIKYDSRAITHSIICVWSIKMSSFLKQKRKHDGDIKKSIYTNVFRSLPSNVLLNCEESGNLTDAMQMLFSSEHIHKIDLKTIEDKLQLYVEVLEKLPIIFCSTRTQNVMILLLMALHKDITHSNCTSALKNTSEKLIIGILQHNKCELLDFCEAGELIQFIDEHFERRFDFFSSFAYYAFKSDSTITKFQSGIDFIKDMKDGRCLVYAVILLNILNKFKKQKLIPQSKTYFASYRSILCSKIINYISKLSPEDKFIEAYAVVLKTVLAGEDGENLSKVTSLLNDYVNYCLKNLNQNNVKGSILLFATVLRTKTLLMMFDKMFVLEVWRSFKRIPAGQQIMDDYSQLVMSISSLLATEQFEEFLDDLLPKKESYPLSSQELKNNLKTWTSIVTTNFNSTKTSVLRGRLEILLQHLLTIIKSGGNYTENLFEEILQLEISIIQANHVPLTASIMDFLLLTVQILMEKPPVDFIVVFNSCICLMEYLLKYRNPLIMDRLPPYLLQYRLLLKKLCHQSSSKVTLHENEVQQISNCAHKLEKITKSLVECTKDMSRIALYLIADILGCYEKDITYPTVKKHLNNCIYSLMSLCDLHAIQYFMRISSTASTEIFKIMYENYKKYRFTGKV